MTSFKNQLIVVSGASSGIGLAMTKKLLSKGYSVLGIAKEYTEPIKEHENFQAITLDLADLDHLQSALAKIIKQISQPLRGLINNAGLGKMGYLEQLSVEDIRLVMNTNFLSHAIVTKCFLPLLKQQNNPVDILFTGSEAALQGARQGSIYCASKFAVRGFAQALREECAKSKVRVTIINPGAVRTPFFDNLHFQPGNSEENAIAPEDIAEVMMTVLKARPGTVIDEINLSPLVHVWQRKD